MGKRNNKRKVGETRKPESTQELTKDVKKLEQKIHKLSKVAKPVVLQHISTSTITGDDTLTNTGTFLSPNTSWQNTINAVSDSTLHGEVRVKSLEINGVLSNTDVNTQNVRIIVIRDKQPLAPNLIPTASLSTYANLMFQTPTVGTINMYAPFIQQKPRRFDVLWDKYYTVQQYFQANGASQVPFGMTKVRIHIPLKDRKIMILPNAVTGSFEETEEYLLYVLTSASITTPVNFDYCSVLRYTSGG